MAETRSGTFRADSTLSASFGPMPLMPVSKMKESFSSAVTNP
jgi:hypothetical protein